MGTRVVTSLDLGTLGRVKDYYTIHVPDINDLAEKADKEYVSTISSNLSNSIVAEQNERIKNDSDLQNKIITLNSYLSQKADKEAIQKIISELSLAKVKSDLDVLFVQHIKTIHETCIKEHLLIEKDIAAFRDFATNANKEVALKLGPINQLFQELDNKINTILSKISSVQTIESKLIEIENRISLFEAKAKGVEALYDAKKNDLQKLIAEQISIQIPKIVSNVNDKISSKKKGFWSRLFGK